MAVIHTAHLCLKPIDPLGNVVDKNRATFATMNLTSSEVRLLDEAAVYPNTAGFPTIRDYLDLEAADGFILAHLDQTYCITQDASAGSNP